jgi:hypothetical protein
MPTVSDSDLDVALDNVAVILTTSDSDLENEEAVDSVSVIPTVSVRD